MKNYKSLFIRYKKLMQLSCLIFFCISSSAASSQILSVRTVQNLNFGAFTQTGSSGTVIISNSGSRSATGGILPLNLGLTYFQAIFEIEAPAGTIISILNGSDAVLTGSNGGTMSLHISNSDPLSPFVSAVSPPAKTQVNIGGVLSIGDKVQSPSGFYTGTFYITFNNE
ncbi:MAG TPA: DUF4402 domain-containing protein [Flavisolibacter sp.]|nr:DUF4402 domain-containing protein [Flavisolibacter sp.]